MLHVYHSNRLEALFILLCTLRQSRPLADPIVPETVLVANPGIGRWLNLQIARRESIAANIDYALPATFVWQLYRDCLDDVPAQSAFEKGALQVRLLALLLELEQSDDAVWQPLQRYATAQSGALSDTKRVQLASRIADVFDQYLVYRPEMLLDWESGSNALPGEDLTQCWQPALWRRLTEAVPEPHRATLWKRFCERADAGQIDPDRLPPHLHIFNVGLLPPSTLDVLVRLARLGPENNAPDERVSLYFLNPAVDYWADLVDLRRAARERLKLSAAAEPLADDQNGNPLLSSLGGSGRTLMRLLGERSEWVHDEQFYLPAEDSHLLAAVQRDLLHPYDSSVPGLGLASIDNDVSVQFHGCYSVLREVQALHDQLLDRFNADHTLEPADVLVMVPDINTYAPVVEAVFGSVGGEVDSAARFRRVPWSVADRSLANAADIVATVQSVFALPAFQFEASGVLAFASSPAIARRFGFDDAALATLRLWLRECGIRRTLAGESDELFQADSPALHSWDFGLRRLLLGRAMPLDSGAVGDTLPWPHVDGEHAILLSQLLELIDALSELKATLATPRSVSAWVETLNALIDRLFLPDEDEADALAQFRELLSSLDENAANAGVTSRLSHASVLEMLNGLVSGASQKNHRYLTGRVTFSSMVPLRSVPFRMVCMLGLNDGDFPRQRPALGFDLIAQHPKAGDRSVRDDDRYLFLEALLSARDELYLSWIARNPNDNAVREPSVLLEELRDYLTLRYPQHTLHTVMHPLQPFSRKLFDDTTPALHSYASEWAAPDRAPPLAVLTRTTDEATAKSQLSFNELRQFWRNPSVWYCSRVLGLSLWRAETEPGDAEPFALDALATYGLRDQLLTVHLEDDALDPERVRRHFERNGSLPHGAHGDAVFETVSRDAEHLAAQIRVLDAEVLAARELDLSLPDWQVSGRLIQCVQWPDGSTGVLHSRPAKPKGRDLVGLMLSHLVGSAAGELTGVSRHIGLEKPIELPAVDSVSAVALLQPWIEGWSTGQRNAIPFFADTSPVLVGALSGNAQSVWIRSSGFAPPGESEHEAIQILYPDTDMTLTHPDTLYWAEQLFGQPLVAS